MIGEFRRKPFGRIFLLTFPFIPVRDDALFPMSERVVRFAKLTQTSPLKRHFISTLLNELTPIRFHASGNRLRIRTRFNSIGIIL
ncbi:hypothetical protein DLM76_10665 [Leptospira yasudae]|nr:hypothetical protein DLM76_10665 [Leptospira yasudae]